MEIREAIGIKKGEKILLSVSAAEDGKVTIEVAKAPENLESDFEQRPYSRNGAYLRKKRGVQND
ncbi:MAG TPA: hypothetical protein EYP90_02215 [Chromatiaceae bacterium]|nr:hypothetical protein [Chromatiaceae bacterium]